MGQVDVGITGPVVMGDCYRRLGHADVSISLSSIEEGFTRAGRPGELVMVQRGHMAAGWLGMLGSSSSYVDNFREGKVYWDNCSSVASVRQGNASSKRRLGRRGRRARMQRRRIDVASDALAT